MVIPSAVACRAVKRYRNCRPALSGVGSMNTLRDEALA